MESELEIHQAISEKLKCILQVILDAYEYFQEYRDKLPFHQLVVICIRMEVLIELTKNLQHEHRWYLLQARKNELDDKTRCV
jgi:hypothetical protein